MCVWSCNQSGQLAGLPARSSSVHAQCLALFFWVWVAKEPQCDCWQKRPFLPRQARVSRGGQLWAEPTLQPVPGSVVTWVPWSRLGGYTCPFLLHLSPAAGWESCWLSSISLLCSQAGNVRLPPPHARPGPHPDSARSLVRVVDKCRLHRESEFQEVKDSVCFPSPSHPQLLAHCLG